MAPAKKVARRRTKAKLKPSERVVFLVVAKLVDPATGEEVKAFLPQTKLDREVCQSRGYRVGDHLMADLFKERNARFFRLAHGLAKFVQANTDYGQGMNYHQVLKQLQKDANVACDNKLIDLDLGTLGRHQVAVREPRSLNFADMDDGQFAEVWDALCEYVRQTWFATWNDDQVAEAAEFWEDKSA